MTISPIRLKLAILIVGMLAASFQPAWSQPDPSVEHHAISIWSDGTRLAGDLFYPKDRVDGEKLPAIVLCHGWGGTKDHLNQSYAPKFAAAGFYVLTFDYRGWGESDSRLVNHGDIVVADDEGNATAEVQVIRELDDPVDQLVDIQNALHYIEGEKGVDTNRIGLWGTSFGGGLVVSTASKDERVKCLVSQVGAVAVKSATIEQAKGFGGAKLFHSREIRRARGVKEAPVPQGGMDAVPGLRGTPHVTNFARYSSIDEADTLNVPTLIIDAENEELFDRHANGEALYEKIKDRVPATYHVEPGIKHYGIYQERYVQGSDLARDWFVKHLK